ncbi:hypothetical protein [Microbacterium immunditiarum]|uniref:Uncharacterized protein n=1 Tax=Microbacterium immunditiarum TaxID=337480 RepID=A0A7Y9KKA4_9MICO|nr:hypothetical protein [Microbacterium immunditiarum]NYE19013.1 hypothetical protein [Microbacterium immunditiarum]
MSRTRGPLRRCRDNPRYFEDADGRFVWLTGSHTWANLATDQGNAAFDFTSYVRWAARLGHTMIRGWNWDLPHSRQGWNGGPFDFAPSPFARAGPGLATDGRPRFDLTRPEPAFFDRLRDRVLEAGESGLYVSIMLFQGFAWQFNRADDDGMPYDGRNNVNGVDAGRAGAAATLGDPAVLAAQERYVRWVVDAVGDLDNVLYEIANEAAPSSTTWQHHLIGVLRTEQERRGMRHPIGMTHQFDGGSLDALRTSGADWISPDCDEPTRRAPPPAEGEQVVVYDSDHGYDWRTLRSQPASEQRAWVWRCLLRGAGGVLFMDPFLARIEIDGVVRNAPRGRNPGDPAFGVALDPFWNPLREALGHARRFADALDLRTMLPRPGLADGGWCLADPGRSYAVFVPTGAAARIRLEPGVYDVRRFDPATGSWHSVEEVTGVGTAMWLERRIAGDAAFVVTRRGVSTPRW